MSGENVLIRIKSTSNNPTPAYSKYATELEQLDANKDGIIDREELLQFIAEQIEKERKFKYVKYGLLLSLLLILILVAANAGIIYAVVVLTNKVSTGNANGEFLNHLFNLLLELRQQLALIVS